MGRVYADLKHHKIQTRVNPLNPHNPWSILFTYCVRASALM